MKFSNPSFLLTLGAALGDFVSLLRLRMADRPF